MAFGGRIFIKSKHSPHTAQTRPKDLRGAHQDSEWRSNELAQNRDHAMARSVDRASARGGRLGGVGVAGATSANGDCRASEAGGAGAFRIAVCFEFGDGVAG